MFGKLLDFAIDLSKLKFKKTNIGVQAMGYNLNIKTLAAQIETITYGKDSFAMNSEISFAENLALLAKDSTISDTHHKHLIALEIYENFIEKTKNIAKIVEMIKQLRNFTNDNDVVNKFLFIATGKKIIDENLYQNPDEKQKHILLATEMNDVYKHSEYPQDIQRSLGKGKGTGFDLILEIVSPIRKVDH